MSEKIQPVYLLAGPEIGQRNDRVKAVRAAIQAMDGEEPEIHRFYPYETETTDILSVLQNGSLFSSRRFVVVSDAHALKAPDKKAFKEYFTTPAQDAVLVFTTDTTPGSRDYPRALADALPKSAVQVFWELFDRDKKGWVMRFLRDKGLQIDPEALDVLLDVTDGTTVALKEACELLAFAVGDGSHISEDDVDRALEHSRDETVYSLFDRFCRRDLHGVLDAYRKMAHSDAAAADRLLSMMADPLARLKDFSSLVGRRVSPEDAARQLKLRGGKRALLSYKIGAQRFSEPELGIAVRNLVDLESWLRTAPKDLRGPKTELFFCRTIGTA